MRVLPVGAVQTLSGTAEQAPQVGSRSVVPDRVWAEPLLWWVLVWPKVLSGTPMGLEGLL